MLIQGLFFYFLNELINFLNIFYFLNKLFNFCYLAYQHFDLLGFFFEIGSR